MDKLEHKDISDSKLGEHGNEISEQKKNEKEPEREKKDGKESERTKKVEKEKKRSKKYLLKTFQKHKNSCVHSK